MIVICYEKYFEGAREGGQGQGCAIDGRMIVAICLMCSTYLVLFVKFFVQRYAGQKKCKDARVTLLLEGDARRILIPARQAPPPSGATCYGYKLTKTLKCVCVPQA